jgi:hypothetical protein
MSGNVPSLYYRDSTKKSKKLDLTENDSIEEEEVQSELKYDQDEYDETRQKLIEARKGTTTVRLQSNINSMREFDDSRNFEDHRDSYLSTGLQHQRFSDAS